MVFVGLSIRVNISIHAPAKGATLNLYRVVRLFNHFNPRSREGSDRFSALSDAENSISIHAPAKGATPFKLCRQFCRFISIHAPAKGATHMTQAKRIKIDISIHAPAKGATAKITKTIPNDLRKINNYNNSFTQICAKHNCKFDIR